MLAEIFFLQMEATLRASDNESTYAPKFVPFDQTALSNFKKSRTPARRGPSTAQ
jgi:hypothetical protein